MKINRRHLMLGAAAGAATLAMPAVVGAQQARIIRYTHYQPGRLDQPKHAAALAFKSTVEGLTAGRIRVDIFPAGQIGPAQQVMEQLRLGSLEMAVVHDGGIAGVYAPYQAFSLPFLWENQAIAWKVLDGAFGAEMAEDMRKKVNIRLFAHADNGIRHITNSKRPIVTPDDMRGLKIRVQPSPVFVKLMETLGASASAIDWGELPAALSQGTVDGQENGVTNILAASLYQSQKHITLDGHVYSLHAYMMSDRFFNRLGKEEQAAVLQGVEVAKVIHRGMTAAQDANAEVILKEKGMTVQRLTSAQIDAFRQRAQGPVREWLDKEIGREWTEKLQNATRRAQEAA
ncbi:DctP family TRAP transporter solute-binding subunit [Roseomonas populi]|uniref:DctP family TRAP transporter solute-binding subunit n=1 Tax=Roseomonas populi TaxID=3121582 RepID=A0ABT1X6S9_9PROT|nr:DctP family TRAP transporter solute-binding subunit [Roseomonas pecuniae]MCR0983810.1 DctP family TRAP transporter solute-binding subunit [Roseomonas pecuniae]